eukprot:6174864-Pleurochrysis_carterae.AAC.1
MAGAKGPLQRCESVSGQRVPKGQYEGNRGGGVAEQVRMPGVSVNADERLGERHLRWGGTD